MTLRSLGYATSALGALLLMLTGPAVAQPLGPLTVDFGFVGADSQGDVTVAARETVTLTPDEDGAVYLDSLTMNATDSHLWFERNTRNTPIYLIVSGPVVIPSGATVHVNGDDPSGAAGGKGGPGGFDGADSPSAGQGGYAAGYGPGGGYQQGGLHNYGGVQFMIPLVGGSGGTGSIPHGGIGGGGGGGAILVASQTSITASGRFDASGGGGSFAGATGSVRLLAPVVAGSPTATATRFRIDALDVSGLTGTNGATIGQVMIARPPGDPRIDIIEVDGVTITNLDDGMAQFVQFPANGATMRTVTIRITDVLGLSKIALRLRPEAGPAITYTNTDAGGTELEIHSVTDGVDGQNYAERTFVVEVPPNLRSDIEAWTRPEAL